MIHGPRECEAELAAAYEELSDLVFRTCLRFAPGDRAWALDRTQDTFVTLAEHFPQLSHANEPAALRAWVLRVAVNHCLATLRRRRLWRQRLASVRGFFADLTDRPWSESDPERRADVMRAAHRIERAMARLEPLERAVVTLMYLDDTTQAQTAEILGLSRGYVSKLHRRALDKLRRYGFDHLTVVQGDDASARDLP